MGWRALRRRPPAGGGEILWQAAVGHIVAVHDGPGVGRRPSRRVDDSVTAFVRRRRVMTVRASAADGRAPSGRLPSRIRSSLTPMPPPLQ